MPNYSWCWSVMLSTLLVNTRITVSCTARSRWQVSLFSSWLCWVFCKHRWVVCLLPTSVERLHADDSLCKPLVIPSSTITMTNPWLSMETMTHLWLCPTDPRSTCQLHPSKSKANLPVRCQRSMGWTPLRWVGWQLGSSASENWMKPGAIHGVHWAWNSLVGYAENWENCASIIGFVEYFSDPLVGYTLSLVPKNDSCNIPSVWKHHRLNYQPHWTPDKNATAVSLASGCF